MTYNVDLDIWEATVELGNGEIKVCSYILKEEHEKLMNELKSFIEKLKQSSRVELTFTKPKNLIKI